MTVAERICEVLRDRVLSGQLLPGVRLVEADLTAEFQASRVTIREALRRLVADELLELLPHRGIRVRLLSERDLEELYVVRAPIEGLAARLAAESFPAQVDELRRCCAEGERAITDGDIGRYMKANARFHDALLTAAANGALRKVATRLHAQMISFQAVTNMNLQRMRDSHEGHLEILDAIEAHDADRAEAAMRLHITGAAASFRSSESSGNAQPDGRAHSTGSPADATGASAGGRAWD